VCTTVREWGEEECEDSSILIIGVKLFFVKWIVFGHGFVAGYGSLCIWNLFGDTLFCVHCKYR
jgi:hypothetical protein